MTSRLRNRARRVRDRILGTPAANSRTPTPRKDRFSEFASLDGPVLVGGPTIRHDPALDGSPRTVVLMPHLTLERMSGGPNTIFQVTARLLGRGERLVYVAAFRGLAPDRESVLRHIGAVTGIDVSGADIELVDASAPDSIVHVGADDVLVATWWPTAHVAHAGLRHVRASEFIYLIQDFEPGFYAWSTKYALAAATYEMPARAVVNEPFLLEHLVRASPGRFDGANRAISFLPAVDPDVFVTRTPGRAGPRRLAFYARPAHARNLFELGLRALRVAAADGLFDGEPWDMRAIGHAVPELPLAPDLVLRPVPWMAYAEYAAFLRETDVLLSLMLSPHTSYPPLEMAATGGRTVTNTFGTKTASALAAISPLITAVPPNVGSLVDGLAMAIAARATPLDGGAPGLPATWDDALAEVTPWLAERIVELRAG